MGILDGKVAFVTGAARSQGRVHAETLARAGADLIICDICEDIEGLPYGMGTAAELEETASNIRALGRSVVSARADVRSQAQLDAVVGAGIAEFGRVDVLVANAGVCCHAPVWELTEEIWAAIHDINLAGVWRSVKAVMPHMIESGRGGSIITISSVNGIEPLDEYAHYVSAKHGVIGLMRTVAIEGGPHGIRCNAICPGFVRSGMTTYQSQLDRFAGHPGGTLEDAYLAGERFHPLRDIRALDPQHIADAALWLASPGSEAVNGVSLAVDGGHVLVPGYKDRAH
jgi:SDR family mycofactocin-dependent oxidoreductase